MLESPSGFIRRINVADSTRSDPGEMFRSRRSRNMTLSKLERWKIDFRKAAEEDRCARLRKHLRKLDLPDRPALLLEGTIQSVDAAAVFSTFNRKSITEFINMQSYDGKDADRAMYALTFDFRGKAFGRVLIPDNIAVLDLAELYDYPWETPGFNRIFISRVDGRPLSRRDLAHLEMEITYDLYFDYGEGGIDIDFDDQSVRGVLTVLVQIPGRG
jgi:hypothetical protein